MKSILVPLDGSKFGEAAIPCAVELAHLSGAEMILVHAITPHRFEIDLAESRSPRLANLSEEYLMRAAESAHEYLGNLEKTLSKDGLTVRCLVKTGQPAETILDCAKANKVDLIALSTRGRSEISAFVLGSVAHKVLHASDIPVILVKPHK